MSRQDYNWTRYWYRRDGPEPLVQHGLLHRLNRQYSPLYGQPDLCEITELLDIPCLILLGEPGMGKSRALDDVHSKLATNKEGQRHGFFNLADYDTGRDLYQDVFFENNDFVEWQDGSFYLHLFLDSLDEARMQIGGVTRRLNKILGQHKAELHRLRLRIVCRSSDWPAEFESQLKQLWGKDAVQVYILAPLQIQDVLLAAQQSGLDVKLFQEELKQKEAWPFAARPITLNFLTHEFHTTGQLPETRSDLYRRGCRALCREINVAHAEHNELQFEERYIIAARMAACTIFTRYSTISTQLLADDEKNTLTIQACAGGKEIIGELEIFIYESSVQETLGTGLFKGGAVRQWAHHTYAEFLAAWYAAHTLNARQIKSLLFHSDRRLVPQLQETAAWIANLNEEVFSAILETDPEVLLRSDVATGDVGSKRKLTLALLERCESESHFSYDWNRLEVLKHPGLAQILRPYIEAISKNEDVRKFAIRCAIECNEHALEDVIVQIALDPDESRRLRVLASRAIVMIGSSQTRSQLKSLALLPLDNRENGDLKRYGIRATWPDSLSAAELFATLVAPESGDYLDSYVSESWSELILPELKPAEIPLALHWVQQLERTYDLPVSFAELLDGILLLAWQHLEEPDVAEVFAHTAIALWRKHDNVLDRHGHRRVLRAETGVLTREIVLADTRRRYLLLGHLIPIAANYEKIAFEFIYDVPLLEFDDAPRLIERFNRSKSAREQSLVVELLHYIIRLLEPEQFQFIFNEGQKYPALWQALDYRLFVELDSEAAKKAKQTYLKRAKRESERKRLDDERKRNAPDPPPLEQAIECLDAFANRNTDAWWQMSRWMIFNPEGHSTNLLMVETDMTKLPVWEQMDHTARSRVIASAPKFIIDCDPGAFPWRENPKSVYHPIVAGCRAFRLLLDNDHDSLLSLPQETWRKWASALTFHLYESRSFLAENASRPTKALWRLIYSAAPDEFIDTLLWIIDRENEKDNLYVTDHINGIWDERLARTLFAKAQDDKLTIKSVERILEKICAHDFDLVDTYLKNWLPLPVPVEEDTRERAHIAGRLLLEYAADAGWSVVWPAVQQDTEFGKELVIAQSDRRTGNLLTKLTEAEATNFYVWMFHHFPPENDPKREGFHMRTAEDEVADLRNAIPRHLAARGTKESCRQLKRAQSILGSDLAYHIRQAEIQLRHNTWQPPTPQQLIALAQDQRARWIQNGQQLLDVIIELLEKLNQELQGQRGATPAAIDLWNEYKVRREGKQEIRYTPKDENRLSDYVERYLKRELEERNVFISRETQVRRGSFTDIYVETKPLLPSDDFGEPITVVVEVKGCWHPDLKKAMRSQLKARYLSGAFCKYFDYNSPPTLESRLEESNAETNSTQTLNN